ncbi:hypothetical protein CYJ37_12325 [Bacillus sp. UMB0728]|nr:hypothetical protein CYJ37_12325 [Bacillus sp. UMB0728]
MRIQGSMDYVKEIEVNVDTVYVRSNIQRIETDEFVGWEYDEVQWNKDEYISYLANQNDINQLKEKQLTANEKYELLDKNSAPIEEMKIYKMAQLDEACNLSIIKGFIHPINGINYLFSCSLSAQANFQGSDALFKDGLITEAEWTVENIENGRIERILIDKEMFTSIKLHVFQHINDNISKLRNELQPMVEKAETAYEIDNINW